MRSFYLAIQSKILHKIILPFIGLAVVVALAGVAMVFWIATNNEQDRLDNLVADVTRISNDAIIDQEIANLDFLNQIVFSPEPQSDSTAIATAMATSDIADLQNALRPILANGTTNEDVRLDRLIAFDQTGQTLVDLEQLASNTETTPVSYEPFRLSTGPDSFVGRILAAERDNVGDKFTGLMLLPTQTGTNAYYFATLAPIYRDGEVIGGLILGMRVEEFLQTLARRSHASIINIYDINGETLASTRFASPALDTVPSAGDTVPVAVPTQSPTDRTELNPLDITGTETFDQLRAGLENNTDRPPAYQPVAVMDTWTLNERNYQLAFTPLVIRDRHVGYIAAGLPRDYLTSNLYELQLPIMVLTGIFILGIFGAGMIATRQITRPLNELVETAQSVTAGNLQRRSQVRTSDEIGKLSQSFNKMTEHLLRLYSRVLAESGQRSAIVESIADGIVVCDPNGYIRLLNRATRNLLNLENEASAPNHFNDLPLVPLPQNKGVFGSEQGASLYTIGERIVRLSGARVTSADSSYLGDVYVLQDMTAEVNIDQAKTEFIGTISHELRSPITTLLGTTGLLLRGTLGAMSDQQREEVNVMQHKLVDMTELINNVIVIASMDSGSLELELEPLNVREIVEEAVQPLQRSIEEKGLSLELAIPEHLPPMLADYDHVQTIIHQLVSNARTYTEHGGITIRASQKTDYIQIDVCDTGRGIPADMHEQIFERFVRLTEQGGGANSPDRGIGLGLAIVKQLVKRHGGRIWVTSKPNEGSIFSFTLKYQA